MKIDSLIFLFIVLLAGCSKKKQDPPVLAPEKPLLVFPAQNTACLEGKISSATHSTINFAWNTAANTETYTVIVKNLSTGQSLTKSTEQSTLELTLIMNTPYSWSVTSKNSKSTNEVSSDVWKFYNSGPGIISYAPFPAEITSPLNESSVKVNAGKISLDWNGSDVDGDISGYAVYLGTTSSPSLLNDKVSESILSDVSVISATTYFWKVITKDSKGNTSDSGVHKFYVE